MPASLVHTREGDGDVTIWSKGKRMMVCHSVKDMLQEAKKKQARIEEISSSEEDTGTKDVQKKWTACRSTAATCAGVKTMPLFSWVFSFWAVDPLLILRQNGGGAAWICIEAVVPLYIFSNCKCISGAACICRKAVVPLSVYPLMFELQVTAVVRFCLHLAVVPLSIYPLFSKVASHAAYRLARCMMDPKLQTPPRRAAGESSPPWAPAKKRAFDEMDSEMRTPMKPAAEPQTRAGSPPPKSPAPWAPSKKSQKLAVAATGAKDTKWKEKKLLLQLRCVAVAPLCHALWFCLAVVRWWRIFHLQLHVRPSQTRLSCAWLYGERPLRALESFTATGISFQFLLQKEGGKGAALGMCFWTSNSQLQRWEQIVHLPHWLAAPCLLRGSAWTCHNHFRNYRKECRPSTSSHTICRWNHSRKCGKSQSETQMQHAIFFFGQASIMGPWTDMVALRPHSNLPSWRNARRLVRCLEPCPLYCSKHGTSEWVSSSSSRRWTISCPMWNRFLPGRLRRLGEHTGAQRSSFFKAMPLLQEHLQATLRTSSLRCNVDWHHLQRCEPLRTHERWRPAADSANATGRPRFLPGRSRQIAKSMRLQTWPTECIWDVQNPFGQHAYPLSQWHVGLGGQPNRSASLPAYKYQNGRPTNMFPRTMEKTTEIRGERHCLLQEKTDTPRHV